MTKPIGTIWKFYNLAPGKSSHGHVTPTTSKLVDLTQRIRLHEREKKSFLLKKIHNNVSEFIKQSEKVFYCLIHFSFFFLFFVNGEKGIFVNKRGQASHLYKEEMQQTKQPWPGTTVEIVREEKKNFLRDGVSCTKLYLELLCKTAGFSILGMLCLLCPFFFEGANSNVNQRK